jgi:predicted permease
MNTQGRWVARVRMAMLSLFRRGSETTRLNEELQFHLEHLVQENIAHGASPQEARTAALRTFGNLTLLRDQSRSTWSWSWLEASARDLRYGARRLVRSPGFACIAILVMALGIGAATSLFTIVRSVLLKPLPFRDPDKLVMVNERFRENVGGFNMVSPADYRDWRAQTHGFADMAAWRGYSYNLTGESGDLPEVIQAAAGSSNLFNVLGVQPALGRAFTADEDQPGGNHVAMLSWSLFQRRFSGDSSVLGKKIRLDTNPYTIIGVLPRSFTYPDVTDELWVPYASTFRPLKWNEHDNHQSNVIARLRPDVSASAAVQQVSALQYQIHLAHANQPVAEDAVLRPVIDNLVEDVKTPLLVLLAAVGCMLLIACLNVSNLLVARGAARRKEVAVRGALGGSRLTLIREQMSESLLISMAGGLLGIMLSIGMTSWLAGHWKDLPRAESIHADAEVLAFSLGIVVFAALFAGLLPAISSTGASVLGALQESSRSIGGSIAKARLRKVLLIAEIALTVILLVCAGLLFKSFLHLRTDDLGCDTTHVMTMKYGLPESQYNSRDKVLAFHQSLLERVRQLPGVQAAGLVSTPPGGGYEGDSVFSIPGRPAKTASTIENDALDRTADPGYFAAMQIPILRGRVFTDQERLTQDHFIVINQKLAEQYFPGVDPVGREIITRWEEAPAPYRILGVVGNTPYDVAKPVKATVYHPIFSGNPVMMRDATLVIHTTGDPLLIALPAQKQLAALDPTIPISEIFTMQQILGRSTASESLSATLLLAFGTLSLLLAAVGLYGVLSYLVTQRIVEIGIRLALGAQRADVLRLILLDGLQPVFFGLALGIVGGIAAGALIRSQLYGTSPYDPTVFVAMVASLLLTAALACAVPAIRASRVEPMQALRTE